MTLSFLSSGVSSPPCAWRGSTRQPQSHPRLPAACRARRARGWRGVTSAKGPSLADQLLDVIEGGPKLRRWYGAEKKVPREPGEAAVEEEAGEPEDDGVTDAVLVTEADSALGEAVVFALLVADVRVRLLCKSTAQAEQRFGSAAGVKPVAGAATDAGAVRAALRGCSAVVITGPVGAVLKEAAGAAVKHVVLASRAPRAAYANPLQALMQSGEERQRAEPGREAAVLGAGMPVTVLRLGAEVTAVGGKQMLAVSASPAVLEGSISVEDAAAVTAAVLQAPPASGARVLEVVSVKASAPVPAGAATLSPADRGGQGWVTTLASLPMNR
jgi:hypothetical protein